MLSATAQKLFEALPRNGSKIGGITLQRELEISKAEYRKAREELKEQDLVVIGGGRGGSLARVEGKEPEGKTSKNEALEYAREAKVAKGRAQRELDEAVEAVYKWAKEKLDYDVKKRSDVYYHGDRWMVAVWKGSKAKVVVVPQLELDMLRAKKVR